MQTFFSTNQNTLSTSFEQAVVSGRASDQGLYLPAIIPTFSAFEIAKLEQLNYYLIFEIVAKKLLLVEQSNRTIDIMTKILTANIYQPEYSEIEANIYSLILPLDNNYLLLLINALLDNDQTDLAQNKTLNIDQIAPEPEINVAVLVLQISCFFEAYARLSDKSLPLVIALSLTNDSCLCAALIAKRLGLPIKKLLVGYKDSAITHLNEKTTCPISQTTNFPRINTLVLNDPARLRAEINCSALTKEEIEKNLNKLVAANAERLSVSYSAFKKFAETQKQDWNVICGC